jgi:teichuronic acid biosynthesis glycosyltransferase TuaG
MSQDNFSVDVIIPTFNSDEFLEKAVESCLQQTYPVNRIIIVDDGSSRESQSYLKELENQHPNLIVIFNHHTGLPAVGRHLGISHSEADWIAFLDSDDYWAPEKIQRQIEVAAATDSDFIYTNAYIVKIDSSLDLLHASMPLELTLGELLATNWIVNSSVLLKRSIFDNIYSYATSPRVRAVEDYATWLRLITWFKFAGIPEPLTFYRDSTTSLRSMDRTDPRIFALADFILWTSFYQSQTGRPTKFMIKKAIRVIRKQYLI